MRPQEQNKWGGKYLIQIITKNMNEYCRKNDQ